MTDPGLRLVRSPLTLARKPILAVDQRLVIEHAGGPLLVVAGPGTGKTTTLVEAVVDRIQSRGVEPERLLVLTFGRRAAGELRERISARLGGTVRQPLARTFHSFTYGLLHREALLAGAPRPRLLSGAEQDVVVRELLRGDLALGTVRWPDQLRPALGTRGFAQELRALLLRAVERGLDPQSLRALGKEHDRPEWVAAGAFLREYLEVTALSGDAGYDTAEVVRVVAERISDPGDPLAALRGSYDWVLVDEYQDTDPAQELLLRALVPPGGNLIAVGDPHQSIYEFRGADVRGIARFPEVFRCADDAPAPVIALRTSRRCAPAVLTAALGVADRLPGPVWHRRLESLSTNPAGRAQVLLAARPSSEAALIASVLRQAHLQDDIPWDRMAVLLRSTKGRSAAGQRGGVLRRALASAGVPVQMPGHELALVEAPAVAMLLDLVGIAAGFHRPTLESVLGLLAGPVAGLDPVELRGLRRELRRAEVAAGGDRSSSELLLTTVTGGIPTGVSDRWARRLAQLAAVVEAVTRQTVAETPDSTGTWGALWAAWEASGLGPRWLQQSLAGGPAGLAADRDLDAVVLLFEQARRFHDDLPGAGLRDFIDSLRAQEVPGDDPGASPLRRSEPAVRLLTAHSAKGLEWDLVVVAGVQEGVWPDLRLRGSLLGSEVLVDLLDVAAQSGPISPAALQAGARARRLAEERRLFYVACTRARHQLVVTAVRSQQEGGEMPSRFLDELVLPDDEIVLPGSVDQAAGGDDTGSTTLGSLLRRMPVSHVPALVRDRWLAESPQQESAQATLLRRRMGELAALRRPMSLPPLVGELRATLVDPGSSAQRTRDAAHLLARLARAEVPGADPDQWYDLPELSDPGDLVAPGALVAVSPSQVETFHECPLRWLLTRSGARDAGGPPAAIGLLVHELAALAAEPYWQDIDLLLAEVDRRLPQLDLGGPWFLRRERERIAAMLRQLLEWMAANPRTVVAVEAEVNVVVERARLAGRVDRLEVDQDGRGVVVDIKTSAHLVPGSAVQRHQQLGVYQVALEAGAFRALGITASGGARLAQLSAKRASGVECAQPALREVAEPDWARTLLREAAEGMAGRRFPARRNQHCATCPVRSCCPLGTEEGPR